MAQSEAVKAALMVPKSVTKTIEREWPCSSIPVVHALNVNKKTCKHFTKLSRKLGFKMLLNYSNQVTHVVVDKSYTFAGEHRNNLYSASLQGQWIVDMRCKCQSIFLRLQRRCFGLEHIFIFHLKRVARQ